ncbi:MAG: hypothetical protein JKY48_08520 [Flavobacteriales bacterium]|nr:hypothetical protein [Flavobacteriales bacterium]
MKAIVKFFYFLFIIILLIPFVGLITKTDFGENCENRVKNESFDVVFNLSIIEEFETYFIDNLGFKSLLTNLNASFKYHFFRSSSHPHWAVIGQNNWAFYTDNDDTILKSYARVNLLTTGELEGKAKYLAERQSKLNKMGIQYQMVVFPNKSTIYFDELPFNMRLVQKDTLSKIDQMMRYLRQNEIKINLLDVREALFRQKDSVINYLKFDSHWNDLGCFAAYQELAKAMGLTPLPESEFEQSELLLKGGDLGRLTGLCISDIKNETTPMIFYKGDVQYGKQETEEPRAHYWVNQDSTLTKRAILFGDSYSNCMVKFLALHFKELYYLRYRFEMEPVERIKPDVVIASEVERYFLL